MPSAPFSYWSVINQLWFFCGQGSSLDDFSWAYHTAAASSLLPGAGGLKMASLLRLGFGAACEPGSLSMWSFIIHWLGKLLMIMLQVFQGVRDGIYTSFWGLGCRNSHNPHILSVKEVISQAQIPGVGK